MFLEISVSTVLLKNTLTGHKTATSLLEKTNLQKNVTLLLVRESFFIQFAKQADVLCPGKHTHSDFH